MRWALFGRVVWSIHPANGVVGTIYRVGLRTFATKQEGRAAKHEMIADQIVERMRPVTLRYFVKKLP
jgi:hypothetical protein